jgi:hypothetical protein
MLKKLIKSLPESWRNGLKALLPNTVKNSVQRYVGEWAPYIIMSYPKCGRTWLRLVITRAVYEAFPPLPASEDEYLNFQRLYQHAPAVPMMQLSHDDCQFKKVLELERDKRKFSKSNVLFLVRDPRDVVVSWFFHTQNRKVKDFPDMKADSLSDYLHNERGGLKTIVEFFNIWMEASEAPQSFMLMKYEELKKNTLGEVRRFFDFLECSEFIPDEAIQKSIDYNSFEKMKKRERDGAYEHPAMEKAGQDNSSFKTRRGKVGGYVDYLNEESIQFMNDYIKENLNPSYGY